MSDRTRAIVMMTAVCGTLDILSAFLFAGIAGMSPGGVLRFVASGPFGDAMRKGGSGAAALGLVVHFGLMLAMCSLFALAASKFGGLRRAWLASGIAYGVAIYAVMYWLVMPARFGTYPGTDLWSIGNALFSHIFCVGLPMAWIAKGLLGRKHQTSATGGDFLRGSTALIVAVALLGPLNGRPASAARRLETAVLAGGCFWGTEGVFEHVKGVRNVVSGYAGGTRSGFGHSGGGRAGFAEAVRITYDPAEISYPQLLEIFFNVAHDPTQIDRQGPDIGPRYRSAIFPQNAQQRQTAQRFLARLGASSRFARPIATRIEGGGFNVAEPEHQDYMRKHPNARYVIVNDLPKLAELRRSYPQFWRE